MRAWGELQKDELAAAATLGFTEQLWKTWSSMQAGVSTHQWLSGLKMSELMAIAREAGVKPERLDDALDELHPKAAIVGLMNQQATRAFAMDFTELNDEQVSAATVLGLGPDRFTRNPTGGAAFVGGGAAPPVAGPGGTAAAATAAAAADEDELVLLEPAVFSEGERPSCPKCGILAAPIRGAPVQRARFPCCGVEATPYEVTIAEARRLFASGDFDEAESMFDEAAMLGLDEAVPEEERATCYLYRGLSLVEMDEMDEAMECFASSCEIVALGTRRADKAGAEPAPAPEPATAEGGVSQASTSAVASYIHGLLLRSEGRDESKAKALIDAAIQMAASPAIEDIASNVEEVTRSVGTKDYGKKHTYE
jgi:tetratricopeptide (TPR) repeat protein